MIPASMENLPRQHRISAGKVELLLSRLLRSGVATSLAVISVGLLLMFVHHPQYLYADHDLKRLTSPGAAFPHSVTEAAVGLREIQGRSVIVLGLILLIATPILRVLVMAVVFAIERDRLFFIITGTVLIVLLVSFILGKSV